MNLPIPSPPAIDRILFRAGDIAARLDTMAADITAFYAGQPLTVVAILNGSLLFCADLLRRIPLPQLHLDCLSVASYDGAHSTNRITFGHTRLPDVDGRQVLLVDDIFDTGQTLHAVRQRFLAEAAPASVRIAVLLRKDKPVAVPLEPDYVGFEIGDAFVVGYGLDYRGLYRNLPEIAVLNPV